MKNLFHLHKWKYVWLTDDLEGFRCTVCGKETLEPNGLRSIKFVEVGIRVYYHGDEVIYIYPWKRKYCVNRFYSILFNSYFKNLKELDKTWKDYSECG